MQSLVRKAKDLGIDVHFIEMDKDGYYIPEWCAIFIRQDLDERSQKEVLIHELKHVTEDSDFLELYKIPSYHSKMEAEADLNVVNYLINENDGYFNLSEVNEEYRLYLGWEDNLRNID